MNTYLKDSFELKYIKEKPDTYTITLFKLEKDKKEIGKVYYVIYENELYISLIIIEEEYRGQGIGTYLMLLTIEYYINFHKKGIKCSTNIVALEDMSDRPWKPNNIYINMGFKYTDEEPYPDMLAYVCEVYNKKNIDNFNNKYRKNKKGIFK